MASSGVHAEIRVPAATAYIDPDPAGARVSARGITGWKDATQSILWFGKFETNAPVDCTLVLRLATNSTSKLRLTVAGQSRDLEIKGQGTGLIKAEFGEMQIPEPGYQRFQLQSLNAAGQPFGDIDGLILNGPATTNAHFNLKPRRNAASVHLKYPVPLSTNVAAFYCEVTGVEDPLYTYYMACGWHRGYFGMQVNSASERRIIFSVWDSGNEATSRAKVGPENRVTLIAKGEGVDAGDFGNEGTGGHSHLVYPWKTGEPQRFFVTAQPTNETYTIYSGYYFRPDQKRWMLIASWQAPHDGACMHGLYSFSENFGGDNGHLRRKALYGNQWIRTDRGTWVELDSASFSHDATGRADRLDRFMGVENGQFFLSQGGFVPGFTKLGELFTRPPGGRVPDIELPALH